LKRPARVSEEAEAEATEASRWYDARRPGLGDEFLAALDEALERIELNPDLGSRPPSVSSEDVRRMIMRRFPYDVVYIELSDRIQVLAVAHERRRPGYWVDRIRG
jgi:plasmid stabilization system protein ParE